MFHGGITFDDNFANAMSWLKVHMDGCQRIVGFDCNHAWDASPNEPEFTEIMQSAGEDCQYRDFNYVLYILKQAAELVAFEVTKT